MVNLHGSLRQDPRGGIREVLEVGGTLVRGGSDPGLVRAGDVMVRPVRRSACSLPASLAGEARGTPAREARPRSGVPARRMLRVTRDYLDPRRRARVRHTVVGREHGRDRGRAAGHGSGAALSASLAAAAYAASPARPHPSPQATQQAPAAHASTVHTPAAPTASTSTAQEAARPRRYRRGVAGLASVLRGEDRRAPLRQARRRPERDAKSRKYVAGSARGRHLRPPPLWRPSRPPSDPVKPRGGSCCCCPTAMRTTPCSALVLLPLHLLLLLTLVACLMMGAFVFQALEGPGGGGEGAVEVTHSAIVLPGTPRDTVMTKTREEVVDKLLNASLTLVLHKSLDVIIKLVITTPKMQAALRAFQQAGGGPLPTEKDVERFNRTLMTEWRHQLYDLTARYHALVLRHAHGFPVGHFERSAVWTREEPPPPLPWTLPTALVYSFCLVTTTGGLQAATDAGRAAGVFYSVVGLLVYLGVVVVWAARLGATLSLLLNLCTRRRKQENSPGRKGKGGASPYHKMHSSHPSQPTPPIGPSTSSTSEHTAGRVCLLFLLLFVYILGVGAQVLGGETFWVGLENAIYALLTIRPPRPLPQSVPRVIGYLVFTLCGHLLLGLFVYSLKELCVKWWRLWGRTS
ncbi:uncharacterized protein LOC135113060 [Scylla paramamosain]|uniref:uncharacterized protein LOC135113060 n=1 Tax=Scylla paramamosain TaxID=85552 RepID=UPI003082DE60